MNIKPLADRVLVLPAPAEEKVGGIIIPDTAKEKPQRGKVVATGKGTKDEEMILKEGDTVLYGKYAGTELEFDGTKYIMMRQSDVLGVVEPICVLLWASFGKFSCNDPQVPRSLHPKLAGRTKISSAFSIMA